MITKMGIKCYFYSNILYFVVYRMHTQLQLSTMPPLLLKYNWVNIDAILIKYKESLNNIILAVINIAF